ncbi:MAG TPA: oligosaccharide flippase family protein, partial [Longimicrobiaceae bacterium]|nr:oligosaccharide flippase family protein [Longimicrobiaceae bacterium]
MSDTATVLTRPPELPQRTQSYAARVIHSFLWQGGAQLGTQLISWVSTLIVIRLLTPGDYGLMAMATLFLGFLFLVADLGIGSAAVQSKSFDKQQLRELGGVI